MTGRPWSAGLPIVSAPASAAPKPVTLVYPFYQNHEFLRQQLAWWHTYPAHVRAQLSAIIVDDGSPATVREVFEHVALPFPVRLFRIAVDVRWNWLAARNIGLHHAPDGWCLVSDMDHVVPGSTAMHVVYGEHDPAVIYGFSRIEHTGAPLAPHPNSWLLTRAMFWRVGGYDEALSGHYGTDGDWRRRCAATARLQILSDRLIRHEHVGDSSTTAYKRKQPEDAGVQALLARRALGWRPRTLSFPYEELPLC
jgi:hypothetical protein